MSNAKTDGPDIVAEAEALDRDATPGPWFDSRYHEDGIGPHIEAADGRIVTICSLDVPEEEGNGAFIASSRELLPALAAEVKRLRAGISAEVEAHEAEVADAQARADHAAPEERTEHQAAADVHLEAAERLRALLKATP